MKRSASMLLCRTGARWTSPALSCLCRLNFSPAPSSTYVSPQREKAYLQTELGHAKESAVNPPRVF